MHHVAIVLLVIGSGLVAGVFFAFSSVVMPALARLRAAEGSAAMRAMNATVLEGFFPALLLGIAVLAIVLSILAFDGWILAGTIAYAAGTVLVTAACNVPRNRALAAARIDWCRFLVGWALWNHVRTVASVIALGCFAMTLASCTALAPWRTCADAPMAGMPPKLSQTGMTGAIAYTPRFELWSDGATKQRWIALPPGTRIDDTDVDGWRFPTGTKLWKELARDGVRVETRYLEKTDDGWRGAAYVWDGDDATLAPEGRTNARGTAHDVPSAGQCQGCHAGRALGVSAIQLAGDPVLEHLVARPVRPLVVPGDATEQAALGYLHANCAHCHQRETTPGPRCFDPQAGFDLALRTTELARVEDTAAYRTARGTVVVPGDPDGSALFRRASGGGLLEPRMPALGAKTADAANVALLRRWIGAMRPRATFTRP